MSPRDRRAHPERGTSTLEVAALAPLLVLLMLVLLYAGLALYGISATQTAARQAARAESLGQDPAAAARDAMPGWLDPTVSVSPAGRVTVRTDLPDMLPMTDLVVTREAVMP